MEQPSNSTAIADLYEKTIAMDMVLQYLCAVLSSDQSEKILKLLQKQREFMLSLPNSPDWPIGNLQNVFSHVRRYEEILSGLPTTPAVH